MRAGKSRFPRLFVLFSALLCLLPALALAERSGWGSLDDIFQRPEDLIDLQGADPESFTAAEDLPRSREMTLMIYLCGSSLEDKGSGSMDLVEMVRSGFDGERLNVVVMAGGAQSWALPQIRDDSTAVYQVGSAGIRLLEDDGRLYNMGDPRTLRAFLKYTREAFPSDHYALILWDHGEGSLIGVCHDVNFEEDCLTPAELQAALHSAGFSGKKLDWIGFDACLMGSAEIAKAVAPYAQYMIASQETEPKTGWDYTFLAQLNGGEHPAMTGERIARVYLENGRAAMPGVFEAGKLTLSCVDLSGMEPLADMLGRFISTVKVRDDTYADISRSRRRMLSFGRNEEDPDEDYDLIDLGSMVENLAAFGDPERAAEVMDALSECVKVAESSGRQGSGLTLYFPFYNKALYAAGMERYRGLDFSAAYTDFLLDFGDRLTGTGEIEGILDGLENTAVAEARKDNRTLVSLPLSSRQQETFDRAEIVALQQVPGGESWRLVAVQEAELTKRGELAGEYVHTNLFVTDSSGRLLSEIPLFYVPRDDGLLSVPVQVTDRSGTVSDARLLCSRDPIANRVAVETVCLYDEAIGGYSPRLAVSLSDLVQITCRAEERKENLPRPFREWEVTGAEVFSWSPGEAELRFVRDRLDPETLAVAFLITDIYNQEYMSAPVAVSGRQAQDAVLLDYDDIGRIRIDQAGVNLTEDGMLFLRVQNTADTETLMSLEQVRINGEERDLQTEIIGNGGYGGLDPGEEQTALLMLPVKPGEVVREVCFEIMLRNPDGTAAGKVSVNIRK